MASKVLEGVDTVTRGNDEKVATSSLDGEGKVLGLYFSAHWCPPCKAFTPKLADWYKNLKQGPLKDKFDIVFVSSDRDEKSFSDYFAEMPWLALPYEKRDAKKNLSAKYKISGIPTFLIIDAHTGEVLNKNGRAIVGDDPKGEQFPWREPTLKERLASVKYVNKDGAEMSFSDMEGKHIGIYFSAHWCPPCRTFTPKLAKFYDTHSKDKGLEVIFVSGDQTEDDFKEYLKEMPWFAVPFKEETVREKLNEIFEVEGIPNLVLIDRNLKVVTSAGRGMVERDPDAKDFPWGLKALNSLHGGTAEYINARPCLIYVTGGDKGQIETAKSKMTPTAEEYFGKNKDNDDSIVFMYTDGDPLDDNLCKFLNISEPFPKLFLANISQGKKYVSEGDTIDVADFLKKYENNELTPKGLRE